MVFAARCGACGRRGASPCRDCHAVLRPPAPEPPPAGLAGLVAVLRYEGPARPLVAGIKYRGQRQALRWLAAALAARVLALVGAVDLVTWAPTTTAHRRQRGFDQAELVARAVARRLGVPAVGLLRRGPGPAQTGRPAVARRSSGPRFAVTRSPPAGARVLVVDDVVTTGATLRAAVTAIAAAGGRPVPAAVARTPSRRSPSPWSASTDRGSPAPTRLG